MSAQQKGHSPQRYDDECFVLEGFTPSRSSPRKASTPSAVAAGLIIVVLGGQGNPCCDGGDVDGLIRPHGRSHGGWAIRCLPEEPLPPAQGQPRIEKEMHSRQDQATLPTQGPGQQSEMDTSMHPGSRM